VRFGIASLGGTENSVLCRWLEDKLAEDDSDMPQL
jgi:hypothetical protein